MEKVSEYKRLVGKIAKACDGYEMPLVLNAVTFALFAASVGGGLVRRNKTEMKDRATFLKNKFSRRVDELLSVADGDEGLIP